MPHAEFSVMIRRPPADVFSYLADGMNNREWRIGVLDIERTTTTPGVGAAYRQVMTGPGGRRIDGDYRITACEPPRRLEFLVTAGLARPTGSFELTADAGQGTVVRFALDLQPTGLMKVMSPMISRQMRREVTQLHRLREVLESG
jgi:uncharacterized protein YndB with AHSA1/START domain